jgi:hypothetical protein
VELRLTAAGARIERQQALRGLELLAEASVEMIRPRELNRFLKGASR